MIGDVIAPLEIDRLRDAFRSAKPFPFVVLEDFLDPDFAREVSASYPTFEEARERGFSFHFVNERRKVQVTDMSWFPDPVRRLAEAISSETLLDRLSAITGIPNLLADRDLVGGGMHVTGPRGRLDVHVDFNAMPERGLYRRLNILIYLNPEWRDGWGGNLELWDRDVRRCHHSFVPRLNRCVVFETSDASYHGVSAVRCPPGVERRSFAAYYYTREPPSEWDGSVHGTIFRARPDERFRGYVLMPAERLRRDVQDRLGRVRKRIGRGVRRFVGR
jgi:Rps23 Pro-64 3,4-dihydroxylase Tpa1-like proline 4-hydroxylase